MRIKTSGFQVGDMVEALEFPVQASEIGARGSDGEGGYYPYLVDAVDEHGRPTMVTPLGEPGDDYGSFPAQGYDGFRQVLD